MPRPNVSRLSRLIQELEKTPDDCFAMDVEWTPLLPGGKADAIGCTIHIFAKDGFWLMPLPRVKGPQLYLPAYKDPAYDSLLWINWKAVAKFFDIYEIDAIECFHPNRYPNSEDPTKQQVIERIRWLEQEHGA